MFWGGVLSMAYFLKKTKQQNRIYLAIYESFYSPEVKGTKHRCFIPRRSKARNIAVSGPLAILKPSKRMVSQILFLFIPVK